MAADEVHASVEGWARMVVGFTREMFAESVRCSTASQYIYLNNAKVGCSAIKDALWRKEVAGFQIAPIRYDMQLHEAGFWNYDFDYNPSELVSFTFVRNPYSRALSCYLDKIAGRHDPLRTPIRSRFCLQYGVDPAENISFELFLSKIVNTDREYDDQHWRLQRYNTLCDFIDIDFVGYLETFSEDLRQLQLLLALDVTQRRLAHSKGADGLISQYYTPAAVDWVREKYRSDFDIFGYSADIGALGSVKPMRKLSRSTRASRSYFAAMATQNKSTRAAHLAAAMEEMDDPVSARECILVRTALGQESQSRINAAVERWPDNPRIVHLHAQRVWQSGDLDAAASAYAELVRAMPHNAHFLLEYAKLLMTFDDRLDEAATTLNALLLLQAGHQTATAMLDDVGRRASDRRRS